MKVEAFLTALCMRLSEPSFLDLWDNEEDECWNGYDCTQRGNGDVGTRR